GTPTAAAYAEAAAYLMGTNTVSYGQLAKDIYKKVTTSEQIHDYYSCAGKTYSYLNGDQCYQYYETSFAGSTRAATDSAWKCKIPEYRFLRNTSWCYQTNNNSSARI